MAILEDFKFGAFSITAPKAAPQEIADYNERVLWLDVPQEQSLFFTPTEVHRYSKINKFLVKIKFSQTRVNSLFALKVLNKEDVILKRKITEFINSFWSYVQMDLITVKYSQLLSCLDLLNYHEMLERHDKFLDEIEIGCFLRNRLVLVRLNNLLSTINQLVSIMNGSNSFESKLELTLEFDRDLNFLLKVFAGLPEASSFLCRLNFNNWYSH